jgi:hypothetical protein
VHACRHDQSRRCTGGVQARAIPGQAAASRSPPSLFSVDSRLPDAARRRHLRNARRRSEIIGILLVLVAGLGSARWVTESTYLDLAGIANVPSALGFTMWAGHVPRRHPGAAAPAFAETVAAPTCSPDYPTFVLGMADLKSRVGPLMGEPVECERAVDAEGDTKQLTTTGVAEYAERTRTVTFTDGLRHWALSAGSFVDSIDTDAYASRRR